jgi:hypothetical protein
MKKLILIAGLCLLFASGPVNSQPPNILNWLSSFVPAWSNGNTSGNANNVNGSSVCAATNVTISGGAFVQALGTIGAPTPCVSGATFTVPGSPQRLQVTPDFSNNTRHVNIVTTFTNLVTNVSFRIVDIDKSDPTSNAYFDRVTVTGSDGTNTYNAILTKYDATTDPLFLIVAGNTAYVNTTSGLSGNSNSDGTDQRGTVTVNFGALSINSITIRYDNAAGAQANPAPQAIGVGSLSFTQSTLPVSLTAFSGHMEGGKALLKWTTQQEINAASFIVERSNNSTTWENIGTVTARGNSSSIVNYNFADVNPQGSVLLYRLREVDIDQHYKYSNIIRLINKETTTMLSYPSPFTSQINLNLNSAASQQASAILMDLAGKIVRTEIKSLFPGNNNFTIAGLDVLRPGIYIVEIKDPAGNTLGRSKILKR